MAGESPSPAIRVPRQFEAFYRDEYRRTVSLAYAVSGSRWAAEDLAQEAFLRAHRDWDRVGRMDAPAAWVRRVTVNLSHSRFRRLRSEASARLRLGAPSPVVHELESGHQIYWAAVRRLPQRQADAVALRYGADLSIGDIAKVLGVAEGTVKALLHQGRERLARQLSAKGLVDDETR